MNVNEELDQLRTEMPRPEAKGELILKLQRKQEKKAMKLISKLSIPTAFIALAAVTATMMLPKTALASPETVAKALREARNYVIKSFSVEDGERKLMAKTTVDNGKKMRTEYDEDGNPMPASPAPEPKVIQNGDGKQTITFGEPGAKGGGGIRLDVGGEPPVGDVKGDKHSVEVKVEKGPNGTVKESYVVDGKKVDKLPESMRKTGGPSYAQSATGYSVGLKGKTGMKQHSTVIGMSGDSGKLSTFVSGQTSVDHLLGLLDDESRWKIERGVVIGTQRLDKFTLKGPISPVELYVDPSSSLPRILRFMNMGEKTASIEDVYEYGVAPK